MAGAADMGAAGDPVVGERRLDDVRKQDELHEPDWTQSKGPEEVFA